jgi:hypothetical protein
LVHVADVFVIFTDDIVDAVRMIMDIFYGRYLFTYGRFPEFFHTLRTLSRCIRIIFSTVRTFPRILYGRYDFFGSDVMSYFTDDICSYGRYYLHGTDVLIYMLRTL